MLFSLQPAMRFFKLIFYISLPALVCGQEVIAQSVKAQRDDYEKKMQPFFSTHCVSCHGPKREEGGVRIDKLKWDLEDVGSVDDLQNILDEIVVGSMPPESEPRPNTKVLKTITGILSDHIAKAKELHSSGGGKPIRRLTKTEYINTISDLLGVYVNPDKLPEDGSTGSFDTKATELYTTDLHLETCLAVARDVAERFIASRNMRPGKKKLKTLPKPGVKKGRFSIRADSVPPAGHQIIRLVCWKQNAKAEERVFFGLEKLPVFEIVGTQANPQHIDRIFGEQRGEAWGADKRVVVKEVQNFEVVNPQPYEFFEPFRKKYGDRMPDSAASALIGDFVTLMNRGRKVDKQLVRELTKIFQTGRQQGKLFWEAMVEPMAISMCTLEALFHFETRGKDQDSRYVSCVEMINRISYFLWRSAPDAELIALAESKAWYDVKVRTEQYHRMMEDEKFDRFLHDFSTQWLELDRQDQIAVEDRLFQKFNQAAKPSLKEETIQFMSHVIAEDLPLRNLVDSDFIMVNNHMARHYGFAPVSGNEFRVVPVPPGSGRGGVLTQAGILMQTGTGDRTSIVERGAFVARKFLNDPPGDPPPLVSDLPTKNKDFAMMTGAQLVQAHRSDRQCATCHDKIDLLGTGLEQFDAVGQFRTMDKRLNPNIDKLTRRQLRRMENVIFKVPLETSGKVGRRNFEGAEGLKKALMRNVDRLADAYTGALLSMANGRESGVADEAIIEDIVKKAKKAGLPARSILIEVLHSDAFITH